MPLSEESDPFARAAFCRIIRRRNCAALERCQRDPCRGAPCGWIRCSRNQCQTAPISTGKDPPRLDQQQKRKSQSERPTPPALAFLLPTAAPISTATAPINTGKDRAAHGDGLPICPAWAVSACPMSSGPPPDHLPGLLLPAGPRRRPDDPAALLPAPLPDLPTTPAASPPAPRRQPNARGVRFST